MNIPYQTIRFYNSNSLTEDHISASIPFILAHSPKLSAGIFEVNPLETFVRRKPNSVKFLIKAGFIHLIIFMDHYKKATSTTIIFFWSSSIKMEIYCSKRS
jgi:hypothetical protein